MLKLMVVEDHALVREGMVRLLSQIEADVSVIEAGDFEAALNTLDNEGEVDLVLLDLGLPGIDGFSGLDILRRRYPAMPVAVVSAFDDTPTVTRVMNLGASGFIPKAYSGDVLLGAIREVLAGNLYRPNVTTGTNSRVGDPAPMPVSKMAVKPDEVGLTDRQAQVLALMMRGLSNRDIADQLGLSEGTVKIHATAVFKALGVNSRTQALVAAARYGIDFESVF